MRILIVGPGQCGKDTACQMLAEMTGLRFRGGTSVAIGQFIHSQTGEPFEKIWANRRHNRELWFNTGRSLCRRDPAFLVRTMLENADITNGCRAIEEIAVARMRGVVDHVLWVDRPGCNDPSLEFGPEFADGVINNRNGLSLLRANLIVIARSLRLPTLGL